MKKIMKQIFSVMLVVVMTIGIAPLNGLVGLELPDLFSSAKAVEETGSTVSGTVGENLIWLIDKRSKTLTIDCVGKMPSIDEGNTPWYLYKKYFTKVIINDGCTYIGDYAFYECDNILSIHIPESVENIGYQAFAYCKSLKEINLPSNLTYINSNAFAYCSSLTNVALPSKLSYISNSLFYYCTNLRSVTIPEGVYSIEWGAFYNCYNLTDITIPETVNHIGGSAFYNCRSLTNVSISENVYNIESNAFENCSNLVSVTVPATVMNISANAFTSPTQIICYKNSPAHTFAEKSSLAYWLLDDETQERYISGEIGTRLTWTIDRQERKLTINNQGKMVSFATEDAPWRQHKQYINSVEISDGCTNISENAFKDCMYIVSIDLPDSIETIDDYAFYECRGLREVTIPQNTTSLGNYAFAYCSSLKNVYNLENVTLIGSDAFCECYNLLTVEFNNTDLHIGSAAFIGCRALDKVSISCETLEIGKDAFNNCELISSVNIECSALNIGSSAFSSCNLISSVDIKCSTLNIGSYAFSSCSSLVNVSIDCEATDEYCGIYYGTFNKCTKLQTVFLSEGIDAISDDTFTNCPELSKITILNRECSISKGAISIYATIYGFTSSTAEEYANEYGYRFVSIDAICEHSYTNDCDTICNICDAERETNGHDFSEWTVIDEATCTSEGTKSRTCSICGEFEEETVPMLEHEWNDWEIVKEAACNKSGLQERNCAICGDVEKEIIGITDHTDKNEDGICEVCNKQFEYKYPTNGICGPGLTWVLDDEGVLTISGSGDMFDFNGSNYIEFYGGIPQNKPSEDLTTTTNTNYCPSYDIPDEIATTTALSYCPYCGSYFADVDTYNIHIKICPMADKTTAMATTTRIPTTMATTTRQENAVTTPSFDEPLSNYPTTSSGNQHVPHPDDYVPTTTSRYPIATTQSPTTVQKTTIKYTTTKKASTTTQKATMAPTTSPPQTTLKTTSEWYSNKEDGNNIIRLYRWNLHLDEIKKVVIEEGVTSIGNNAFADCQNLVSVEMPDSLTRIGEYAFNGCSALTEIEIPANVYYIGQCAFLDCSDLETLNFNANYCDTIYYTAFNNCNIKNLNVGTNVNRLPQIQTIETATFADGATIVPDNAFSDCSNLKSVSLPDTIESIGYRAFYYCTALESIDIPDSVTYIGSYAFEGCIGLTTLTTPSGYCHIDYYAFGDCYNLTTLNLNTYDYVNYNAFYNCPVKNLNIGAGVYSFPRFYDVETVTFAEGITYIPDNAFSECYNLTSVNLPESVTHIFSNAFDNCYSLKEINIPDNIEYIGSYAFYNCGSLTEITIPESIYELSYGAFMDCYSLETLTFNASDCYFGGDTFYGCPIKTLNVGANANNLPNFRSVETVTFADGARIVPEYAFSNCTELTSVTLPDSIETIGYRAFDYCTSLETIDLPESLETIGERAFYACYNLKSADLPKNLRTIDAMAFDNCTSLEEINIPNSVTYIGQFAFYACSSIKSIIIPENVQFLGSAAFGNCSSLESVEFNAIECYTNDGYYIFYGCNNISSFKIGSNVTRIIEGLMKDKTKITSVEIPSSVKEIGNEAFRGTSLSAIDLPNGVETIGSNAFADIATATSLTVPETVYTIKPHAFANTTSLEKINFNAVNANINRYDDWYGYYGDMFANSGTDGDGITVVFGESVEAIPSFLFEVGSETAYPNIKNVVIGSNVKTIGDCAFYHCCAIENIDFGASVETIGYNAFDSCIGLKSIELPASLKTIFYNAFSSCNGLTEITIPENVEYIDSGAFSNCLSLETVNFNAANCSLEYVFDSCPNLKTVKIGSNVESISANAFTGATNLEKVYIPDIAIYISPYAFERCEKVAIVCKNGSYANVYAVQNNIKYILEDEAEKSAFEIKNGMLLGYNGTANNIVLPSEITSIGIDAFNGNTVVNSIEIPYNVSKIYSGAFANCSNLEKVIIPFTVTDINSAAFTDTHATIYCYFNSYAYNYAVANNINYELITVTLSTNSVNLVETQAITIDAVPSVTLACGVPLVWKSENPAIASVDSTGKIIGNTAGNTTIGIYDPNGNLFDSCSVTVEEKLAIKFEEPSTDTLKYGEKIILHINTSDLPDGATVKWTTSDGSILKISNENSKCSTHNNCITCTVESVGNSSAEIKATIVDENGNPIIQNGEEISVSYKMNSKVNIWQKIVAFFKKIFGLLKTYPQVF